MIDGSKVLAIADEIDAAEKAAAWGFASKDGNDPIGAAYCAGMIDALDGGWAGRLREACPDGAQIGNADRRDAAHILDMAAFEVAKTSIAVSDMLSDLAQSVKAGDRDLSGFEERWMR